jgi:hypothetical protein
MGIDFDESLVELDLPNDLIPFYGAYRYNKRITTLEAITDDPNEEKKYSFRNRFSYSSRMIFLFTYNATAYIFLPGYAILSNAEKIANIIP